MTLHERCSFTFCPYVSILTSIFIPVLRLLSLTPVHGPHLICPPSSPNLHSLFRWFCPDQAHFLFAPVPKYALTIVDWASGDAIRQQLPFSFAEPCLDVTSSFLVGTLVRFYCLSKAIWRKIHDISSLK